MDAAAQLALMTKAKLVFERPGTFLSFPALATPTFVPSALDFGKVLSDPKVSAALLEFSRTVNQCPDGVIFMGDSDQYLWDHYDQWLDAMDLAQDDLSAAQTAAYTQAIALIRVQDANGFLTDSTTMIAYKQYRDQYLAAEQAYKNAQVAASLASDAAAQAQWQQTDEPRLRQAVAAAMGNWTDKGQKAAVEAAQATVSASEARMPHMVWQSWRNAFMPDLDLFTDPTSNAKWGPSGFAPSDVLAGGWSTFTMSANEIKGLIGEAPKELLSLFGDTGSSAIASISFEFRSAAIVRTWMNSAVFDARFWKFAGGLPDLSDGGTPAQGAWPSYITAVVFARNIKVTTVDHPQAPPVVIRTLPPAMFRAAAVQTLQARPPTVAARPKIMMARTMTVAHVATVQPHVVPTPVPALRAAAVNPALRLSAATYRLPPSAATPPPAPTPTPVPAADDQISILAFICRPLPKVPNPDPSLHW